MHDTALIAQCHVAPRQHIIRNRLPEDLNAQHISYYLLRLALDIGMHKGNVVITAYDVAEGG
jgi:hypothetical protein